MSDDASCTCNRKSKKTPSIKAICLSPVFFLGKGLEPAFRGTSCSYCIDLLQRNARSAAGLQARNIGGKLQRQKKSGDNFVAL